MSNLFVLKFADETIARQVADEMKNLQKQQLVKLDDAALIIRRPDGKAKIKQLHDLVGAGAMGGAFWGLLIGLLFFMPALGAAVGAGAGALSGKFADIGIDDSFIKQVGSAIQPGECALFLMTRDAVIEKVLPRLKNYQFQLIQSSLSTENEAYLREMLGVNSK
ncbi:DUF1269 domain-containing protein [Tengunoibacter tsumagoiensis]|uniref:Membrane protein n=1 Tax=Tengunoibacter tsumagoiensis TaxID=2014871 RepID=A0A402A4P4_9CHLR|nr:DUF1269 domain-containing protein [Tengunoibacter tsumagoiensis]GCE14029.1 membrane protein [Tengunoibacter tsumagoiensis]